MGGGKTHLFLFMLSKKSLFFYLTLLILFIFACLFFGTNQALAKPVFLAFTEKVLGGGTLHIDARINQKDFKPGDTINVQVNLRMDSPLTKTLLEQLDGIYLLLRAERIFDKTGRYHQFTNNYASTILTPSGLPIENHDIFCDHHDKNPVEFINTLDPENRCQGRSNDTPLYTYIFLKRKNIAFTARGLRAHFEIDKKIEKAVPEGYYRFQLSFLCKRGRAFYRINYLPLFNKNKSSFADWDLAILARTSSYLPVIKIGTPASPKMIWTLFNTHYSNGTQGIIANEDKIYFQFSSRHILASRFIIPPSENTTYVLEPDFPTMFAKAMIELELGSNWDFQTPIPLNYTTGELSVSVKTPNGNIDNLGKASFVAQMKTGATTKNKNFRYAFKQYGKYIVTMRGYIEDVWGNRYQGGGDYELWVAHRLTFATSVKPGTPFEVGNSYSPAVIIHPPCPAVVTVDVKLFRNSSKKDVKHVVVQGIANRFGYFYPRTRYNKIIFDAPGEYLSEVTASYTDPQKRLWLGSQRSGSVVAPKDSPLIVHGASPFEHNMGYIEKRGNSHFEGRFTDDRNTPNYKDYTSCTLYPFPYYSGDVLFVANTLYGDNGFVPRVVMQSSSPSVLKTTKATPLFSTTTNQYQPQGYPEFLATQSYAYMSAIRAGFVARFMIAEDTGSIWDAYWQSGANFAGCQINNNYNGDLPQDVYGFLSGVVYRDLRRNKNLYGIYSSMAVVIPKGSYANRISAPLSEPLLEVNGRKHFIFDAGSPLPGLVMETGDILRAGAMIFPPIGRVECFRKIICPSGKEYLFKGISNKIGLAKLVAKEGADIPATEPGVYIVETACSYNDIRGDALGSGDGKYYLYVVDPKDSKAYFQLNLPPWFTVSHDKILEINGTIDESVAKGKLYYTIIMPGIIMDEGILDIKNNAFQYKFAPYDVAVQFPNYDIVDAKVPTQENMADTVIFTFFLSGADKSGKALHSVKRFILRGNQGIVLN